MDKSPQHGLAKFFNFLFDPVLKFYFRYTVKDSFAFVDEIKNLKAKNTFLSSFDDTTLFTSVPLDKIIKICTEKLYILEKPSLRKDNFIRLLKIATQQVSLASTIYCTNKLMESQWDPH